MQTAVCGTIMFNRDEKSDFLNAKEMENVFYKLIFVFLRTFVVCFFSSFDLYK